MTAPRSRERRDGLYLAPRLLQALGILILVGSVVFWGLTGRESVLIVSSAMTLIGAGAIGSFQQNLSRSRDELRPPPPYDYSDGEQ